MSEYVKSAGMKSDEMIRKEAEEQRAYDVEGQRREEEARRKDEEEKRRYKDGRLVEPDDVTADERRAAAKVSAVEQKRLANEKANQEVAKAEAERKAKLKPGQADFELMLEGLRTRINAMQLNKDDTAKFSATIDQLKATSGYVVNEPTSTYNKPETYEATRSTEQWPNRP